jgi:hypothetical protein
VSAIAAAGVIERNYGYDVAGNVLAIDDLGDPDNGRTLSYDNLDVMPPGSEPTVQFGYDVFGNIA